MTKPKSARAPEIVQLKDLINGSLSHRLSQETLLRHWMQSSQMPPGVSEDPKLELTASSAPNEQVGNPELGPRQSEIPSSHKYDVAREYRVSISQSQDLGLSREYRVALGSRDTVKWDSIEDEAREGENINGILDYLFERENVIDILDYLFALHGDQITISDKLLNVAARDRVSGADILDLFLVMKKDQVTGSEEILRAAIANVEYGASIMELLLRNCVNKIEITEEILKAAAANKRRGKEIMESLLGSGHQVIVTESFVEAAFSNPDDDIDYAVLDLLVERCKEKIPITEGIFKAAAGLRDKEVVKKRLSAFLLRAVKDRQADFASSIRLLLDKDAFGQELLSWAANYDEDLFWLLLETYQLDPNSNRSDNYTPMSRAAENNDHKVVKLLMASGKADVNLTDAGGYTPLSRAAADGRYDMVKLLMDSRKADINLKDGGGHTPLARALAARWGPGNVVTLLGKAAETGETDLNIVYKDGHTPLFRAIFENRDGMVEPLLDTGKIKVEDRLSSGSTALSFAAEKGRIGAVGHLLGVKGIDVNSKDKDGRPPLYFAVEQGHDAIVKLLLVRGKADVTVKVDGETPLEQAERLNRTGIVEILRLHSSGKLTLDV